MNYYTLALKQSGFDPQYQDLGHFLFCIKIMFIRKNVSNIFDGKDLCSYFNMFNKLLGGN